MRTAYFNHMTGLNGIGLIQFEGETETGQGIAVRVDPETIVKLAEALKHTDSVGHAVWHVQNADVVMPCSTCKGGH